MKKKILALALMAAFMFSACGSSQSKDTIGQADSQAQNIKISEPETETEVTPEPEPEPEIKTITVTATGDCTLGKNQTQSYDGSFYDYYDNYGENYFFDNVRSVFEADDLTLINLECVLTESNDRVEKTFNLKGKPEYVGIMTGSSVEACSLGNNHTLDYGEQSLADTKSVLDNAGIVYGYNDIIGRYTTDQGITVGIVSANLLADRTQYLRDGIATLKSEGVDLIIACCHWGIEGDHYPTDFQQTTAHELIDLGADLVIGNHPHVLQGIEQYNGKIICYSLGNFCFGGNKNPSDKNTMMFQQTFTFVDGTLQSDIKANIIPCTLSSVSSKNDFKPTIAEGDKKAEILEKVNTYSSNYSDVFFDENGTLSTLSGIE